MLQVFVQEIWNSLFKSISIFIYQLNILIHLSIEKMYVKQIMIAIK